MRIRRTSTAGPTTWRYLDKLGRTIRAEAEGFAANSRIRRDARYDARGRVRLASQPYYSGDSAHYFRYAYDIRGRALGETRPDGGATAMKRAVDPMNANRIKATATETVIKPGSAKPETRETVSLYNVMGELVARTEGANAAAATDRATTTIKYNGAGQPTSYSAAGAVTTYRYDSAGFRDRLASPSLGTVEFEHTKHGELRKRRDGKGTTTWAYDDLGRPTRRTDPGGVAEWTYDPANARGFLDRRCREAHGAAPVASCDALATPDFEEKLTYDGDARVKAATAVIDAPGGARTYAHGYTYDARGRVSTVEHPSGLKTRYGYNARGYRTTLTDVSTGRALETREAMDAFGNATRTTYGNGVAETRAFDQKTGRPTGIAATSGGTRIRDDAYAWRSDGLLASRASHVGGNSAKLEEFDRDPLGRLTKAATKLGGVAKRTLSYNYDARGNLTGKTSSVDADIDVSAYAYDASKPNRLAGATIEGKTYRFAHDADGNIERYDCAPATCDDRFVEWSGRNLPVRITLGDSKTDRTPTARDEFAYGPDGARYYRKATYKDADDALRTERTYHVGKSEELLPHSGAEHASIMRTRASDAVRHVRTAKPGTDGEGNRTTVVESYFEYVHKDHLGSAEGIADAAGKIVRALAHDPYGSRRAADWTAALTEAEIEELAGAPGPRERGHAGHEHLDRTGLIHRGGRVYDPTLGRFLSPDPLVADPASAQAWNGYSYVSNSPMSLVDPSGMVQAGPGCNIGPVMCLDDGGSGAFGVEPVVSTYRYRHVDVFVSARIVPGMIHGGGNGPGALDGWWDFMDPLVEVFHRYVIREAIGQVTGQVEVAGTVNVSGDDIDAAGAESRDPNVVYITGHRWGGDGPWHLAIEYHPDGIDIADATTLSAESIDGKLVSDIDRPSDRPRENETIAIVEPSPGRSAGQLFSDLAQIDSAYCDCLPYNPFPGLPGTEGYNSNSYVRGIIDAAGGTPSEDLDMYFGGARPIPRPVRPRTSAGPR